MENTDIIMTDIDGWSFEERLGIGSSGVVYKVSKKLDVTQKMYSAIKIIELSPEGEKKVQDKINILSAVSGKQGCVRIDECSTVSSSFSGTEHKYLVVRMELLEQLPTQGMEEKDVLFMLEDIAKALCECHEKNIIHRDIKPENILKTSSGEYKLTDFGEAEEISIASSTTLVPVGTPLYVPPETHSMTKSGKRGDIYSLGLTAYCLLNNGLPPFASDKTDLRKALGKRLSGEKLTKPENASANMWRLIERMCAFEVNDRYKDARELLDDIEKLKNGKKIKKSQINKKLLFFAAVAVAVISYIITFFVLMALDGKSDSDITSLPSSSLTSAATYVTAKITSQ